MTTRESDSYFDRYSILLLDEIPFIPFFPLNLLNSVRPRKGKNGINIVTKRGRFRMQGELIDLLMLMMKAEFYQIFSLS